MTLVPPFCVLLINPPLDGSDAIVRLADRKANAVDCARQP
jgi:hypothetical protein